MTFAQSQKGDEQIVVLWERGSRIIDLVAAGPRGDSLVVSSHVLPDSVFAIQAADINGDGKADLVCISASRSSLFTVTALTPDSLQVAGSLSLAVKPDDLLISRQPQAGKNLFFLYGINFPGLITVSGLRGRNLRTGAVVAPDLPVRFLEQTDLNDDDLQDLAAFDWVHNEIHLLYGVGEGRFLDQTTFPVKGTVEAFRVTTPGPSGEPGFVILMSDPDRLEIWQGDGLGDFRVQSSCSLDLPISSMSVADVNRDGWEDVLLVRTNGTLRVVFNTGEEVLDDCIDYAAGVSPAGVGTIMESGLPNGLVLDSREHRLLVYENAMRARPLVDSLQFACGLAPSSIWIGSGQDSGAVDIGVACSASRSIDFFTGSNSGFVGPSALNLEFAPSSIGFHSRNDSTINILVTSPDDRAISFIRYNTKTQTHTASTIPGVGVLEPLAPGLSDSTIQYYCFGAPGEAETPSLSFFQQLGGSRFIERSFRLTIPDTLIGASVADLNADGLMDVAYVYRNLRSAKYELVVMDGDSAGEFTRRAFVTALPDSIIQKSYLYFADFNGDSVPDLFLVFPSAAQTARIALGSSDGSYALTVQLDGPVRIHDRSQVQMVDVDGDGVIDIVANDFEMQSVGFWKGNGDGSFRSWKTLYSAKGISHFRFADLNHDAIDDLVVTFAHRGVLKMIDGRSILKR